MFTKHLQKAIDLAGSEAKLGKGAGFSENAISKAKIRGRISAELALGIDHFLHGQVSASDLRPDLWATPRDVPREKETA